MIEMSHGELPTMPGTQRLQHVQQHHRIKAAGNRDEHGLAVGDQPMLLDGFFNSANEFAHGRMVSLATPEEREILRSGQGRARYPQRARTTPSRTWQT
jgi:hypothetical protein